MTLYFCFTCMVLVLFCTMTQCFEVNTQQGTVIGQKAADGDYYTFYGLFYAGTTAGENRFKPPTPAPNYPGPLHAQHRGIVCAQPSPNGIAGEENCLIVNIFTKNLTTKKPVLVWLVSEDYSTSVPVQSFKSLVEQDIVVVEMNHRLSIFGFLCLDIPEAPGNVGLKDVVQGLKWVKENIAGFGGDPNNVTLFGHGSGAAMVDLITMSPLAKDLVHKAITQSGSALSPWAIAYDPVGSAQFVGEKLQYNKMDNTELAKHLANTQLELFSSILNDYIFTNSSVLFAPCIESSSLNDTFLIDAPINLLRAGNYSHIPYMAGYTNREGTIRAEQAAYNSWLEQMQANFTKFVQVDLDLTNNATKITESIRKYYFKEQNIDMNLIEDYLDFQGDTMLVVSVIRGVKERVQTSKESVRMYEFAYRGTKNSNWGIKTIPLTGARHGVVLDFLLKNDLRLETTDEQASSSLISRYVRFMQFGDQDTRQVPFPPSTPDSIQCLTYSGGEGPINNSSVYSENTYVNPHQQRMTFWDDIYFKYYKAPKPSSAYGLSGAFSILVLAQVFLLVMRL